ncbi:MAG: hypothetical protein E7430_07600 [Ruminococcaceae bacterium]|nr:hypothetical protein [Oscillospiraceae bacterium]
MPLPLGEVAQGQREVSFADLSDLSAGEDVIEMTAYLKGTVCVLFPTTCKQQITKTKLPLAQQLC